MKKRNKEIKEVIIISGNEEKNISNIIEEMFKDEVKKEYNEKLNLIVNKRQ